MSKLSTLNLIKILDKYAKKDNIDKNELKQVLQIDVIPNTFISKFFTYERKLNDTQFKTIVLSLDAINNTMNKTNTKKQINTEFKKNVINYYGEDSTQWKYLYNEKKLFKMTKAEANESKAHANKILVEKNENQVVLQAQTIRDMAKFIDEKSNFDQVDARILVELSSGCRLLETLHSDLTSFKNHPTKNNYVIQTGIAKGDDDDAEMDDKRVVNKPIVFISRKRFTDVLAIARANVNMINKKTKKQLSNRAIAASYGQSVRKRANEYFKKFFPDITSKVLTGSHALRRIYANYSWKYEGGKNVSLVVWISKTLGHKDGDLHAANNYSTIRISEEVVLEEKANDQIQDNTSQISDLKETVSELKQIVKNGNPEVSSEVKIVEKKHKNKSTDEKMNAIAELVKAGKDKYKQLLDSGFTNHVIAKYFKLHPKSDETKKKTVAEVVNILQSEGMKPTYNNIKKYGSYTNGEIKNYLDILEYRRSKIKKKVA